MKVVGIKVKKGVYKKDGQEFEYSRAQFHCEYPSENKDVIGLLTSSFEVKTKHLDFDIKDYLGSDVKEVLYDRYQNVVKVVI